MSSREHGHQTKSTPPHLSYLCWTPSTLDPRARSLPNSSLCLTAALYLPSFCLSPLSYCAPPGCVTLRSNCLPTLSRLPVNTEVWYLILSLNSGLCSTLIVIQFFFLSWQWNYWAQGCLCGEEAGNQCWLQEAGNKIRIQNLSTIFSCLCRSGYKGHLMRRRGLYS